MPSEDQLHAPSLSAPGLAVGIDEDLIRAVVDMFYGKVRGDPLIGPLFEQTVHDWPAHLARMRDFWSSLTLITGRYKGNLLADHIPLPPLHPVHFATWLRLLDETLGALCTPAQAKVFRVRARRVAESLSIGLAIRRGEPIGAGGLPRARTSPFTRARHDPRSAASLPAAMGLGDRLAHPPARLHRRPRGLYSTPHGRTGCSAARCAATSGITERARPWTSRSH